MADPTLKSALSQMNILLLEIILVIIVILVALRILIHYAEKHDWRSKIHNKIDNSKLCQDIIWFFKPFIEPPKELDLPLDTSQQDKLVYVKYDNINKNTSIKYKNEEIIFDKRRALIIDYFFNNQNQTSTFHNFNAWLKNNDKRKLEIDARVFRQEIEDINGRLKKESNYLSSIIELETKDNKDKNKINPYKYKIIYKIIVKS